MGPKIRVLGVFTHKILGTGVARLISNSREASQRSHVLRLITPEPYIPKLKLSPRD